MAKPVSQVYLSYSHADAPAAREVSLVLRHAGFKVWTDQEVLPGDNWAESIQRALDSSDAMVVLLSPDAAQSRFLRREIEYALGAERFENRLIPVMLRDTKDYPWILDHQVIRKPTP